MVQKISIFFWGIGFLFPVFCVSQKNAEFESEFTMTNSQGKSVKFTIGFDRNANEWYEDTIFGEKNLFRPNQDILFRDSFDVMLHPLNVWSFNKSIIQSLKCGEYEYGALQLIVKVNAHMFPLILKWNKSDFSGFCVSRSVFEPSIMGPLTGDYSDIILLRNFDSLIITNGMAKNVSLWNYLGSNNVDSIRYMNLLFRSESVATVETPGQINPDVRYQRGVFILNGVEKFSELYVYSTNGQIINTLKFPPSSSGELTLPWIPPSRNVYIVVLRGKYHFKSLKLFCD
ncbi:MAG: hypothetical protein SH818_14770 [Saprospiraceae bacterium]|nr:hypothetical protein [Saprospiraceae bacterium]